MDQDSYSRRVKEIFQPTHLKFALSLKGQMPFCEFARRNNKILVDISLFGRRIEEDVH